MFKQVKFIVGTDLKDLEDVLNDYLLDIDSDVSIQYDFEKNIAVVETTSVAPSHICCECKHWDDEGNHDALEGACPIRNIRRRYKDPACGKYVRG